MNRNFISVFILLAMLFTINAIPLHKRTITFNKCPLKDTPTLTVSVVPDPVPNQYVAFSVFGTLNRDVIAGTTTLAIGFADASGKVALEGVYYQTFTKSFDAGDTVSITALSVPVPVSLPNTYTIGVAIGDPVVGEPIAPLDIFGCAYAVVGGTAAAEFSTLPGVASK